MLLYAWELIDFIEPYDAIAEEAPDLQTLLTKILVNLTNNQIRRGLRGDYIDRSEPLRGVRGRIDFQRTINDQTLLRAEIHCQFQEHSLNVPRNQIIAATLNNQLRRELRQTPQNASAGKKAEQLKSNLEKLIRVMFEIDRIRLTRHTIATEMRNLGRNEREYKLILLICMMLQQTHMPAPAQAEPADPTPMWRKLDEYSIYERFVANFYKYHVSHTWQVSTQSGLNWNESDIVPDSSLRLPSMKPDIILTRRSDGKIAVIDTKWYRRVHDQRFEKEYVHTNNLYQMWSYLSSQRHRGKAHQEATGILLYAQTQHGKEQLRTKIDTHPFHIETLDLKQPWQDIEHALLQLLSEI